MAQSLIARAQRLIFHPDPLVARLALAGLLVGSALLVAVAIALLGPLLALAAGLGAAAAYLALRSPRWGLTFVILVASLLPFAAFPFRLGFKPTFLDAALGSLVFVWGAALLTGRERRFVGSPLGVPVAVFLFLVVFAFALGASHARPSVTTIRRFAEVILGISLFFVVINVLRTQADLEWAGRVFMLAGAGAALIGVVLYVIPEAWTVRVFNALTRFDYPGGYGALRYIEDNPSNPMRAIGTAIDPNTFGGMLVLYAGFTAPQLVAPRPLFRRGLVALMFAVEVLCLYLTYSRSAMVGLAVALGLIALLRYRKLLLVGALGLGLLLLLPQAQAYVERFVAGIQGQDLATQMRFGEYKDALRLIQRYPVFGVGFSGTPDIDLYIGVSSVYLLMAETTGLVGLTAFLLSMAVFFVLFLRTVRRPMLDQRREALLLGLGGAVAGVLASGVFDHYLFNLAYPHMASLFWIVVGMGTAAVLIEREAQAGSPG
ncbi:MAG: O-antigen ligase family protein [Caldilineales bacterium]|nr:O-antigen ligase family protein [Caldilineales bacterium]MDW8319344.1 O-antigen ligase family protein [Anaerolineae bacterium]